MISEHTKLMNCFIGFSKSDRKFPTPFKTFGYFIDSIEPHFRNEENDLVNPDILFSSNKLNHAIILECKDGGVDIGQLNKYNKILRENFINITSIKEPTKLQFDITIACSENSTQKITKTKLNTNLPILVQIDSKISLSKSYGKFKKKEINDIFIPGLSLPESHPTHYYPYSCDDDIIHISKSVLQTIISFGIHNKNEFTKDDILKDSHPLWEKFDESYKKRMRDKLDAIIKSKHFEKISDYIKKSKDNKYKINTKTSQALQDTCQRIINELQEASKQRKLEEF